MFPAVFVWAETRDSVDVWLLRGQLAYEQGKYEDALLIWERLSDQAYRSARLSYDMGLAAYQLGDFPLALSYAVAALEADPLLKEAGELAELARFHLDRPAPSPEFVFLWWWRVFYTRLSANTWALLALISAWAAALYLLFLHRAKRKLLQLRPLTYFVSLLFLSFLFLGAAYAQANVIREPRTLVALRTTSLHVGADSDSPVLEDLPPGAELHYLDRIGEWYKVRSHTGQQGWVPDFSVGNGKKF